MRKLNIGCGNNIKDGWVNLDMEDHPGVDVVHDLNRFPYPFDDDTFDEILASHVLEHLVHPYKVMVELHRILKKDGVIVVKLPTSRRTDLAHLRVGHCKRYLNCIAQSRKIGFENKELFEYVYVKGRRFDPGRTFFNLRDWFWGNIYHEYEYKIKKK